MTMEIHGFPHSFKAKAQVECEKKEKVALHNPWTPSDITELHCKLWSHCAKVNTAGFGAQARSFTVCLQALWLS